MEESLEILTFELDQLPSSEEFESQIEAKNVPAVFKGCIKDWKAFSKWNPTESGLDSLQELVGSSAVEVMLSRTAPVFYGDIRSHERVPVPFATFIGLCKQHRQRMIYDRDECSEHETHNQAGWEIETPHLLVGDVNPQQMYLAQAPILNTENEERIPLAALKEDIQTPEILRSKALSSVNLWMNNAQAKSSTHYDPHHNLLCIVAGCKQVVLWPPSASALLYPMPVYGEASNHSSVTLEAPDFSVHPRAKYSMEYSQKVVLHAGDALFIPEGWFHQVDSEDLTIAVNFWWRSNIMCSLSEHMDAYYLRRILRRLTDREMNQLLDKASLAGSERLGKRHMAEHRYDGEPVHKNLDSEQPCETESHNYIETRQQGKIMLHELGPSALQALHELVSLVHHRVNVIDQSQPSQSTSTTNSEQIVNDDVRKNAIDELFCLEDDSVAKLLWTLKPSDFQDVCLAMAHNFPRTLEGLILHLLSPVGAEVLTRKFDELDKQFAEEDRSEFYQVFYRAFDDQFTVMDKILNGKELFARQAFNNTLNKYLGVKL